MVSPRGWMWVLLAAVLGLGGGLIARNALSPSPQAVVGEQRRPAFSLQDIDGRMRDASEWDGKVLVVNFWATWCPPCRREIPGFIEVQRKYADQGLQMIGVAIDDREKVRRFAQKFLVNYPMLLGNTALSRRYGNHQEVLPFTVIVDRRGNMAYTHRGELRPSQLEARIGPLLKPLPEDRGRSERKI